MHWKLPASCWEVWTVPLTEFQQEFLRNCSHRWNVKTGATRSGKTYLDCAVTIPKRICAARDEGLCVMLGNTLGTLERNVLEPMRALWGPELVGVVRTSASGNIVQLFGRKVYVLGADKQKAHCPHSGRGLRVRLWGRDHHMGRRCISDAEKPSVLSAQPF